MTEDRIFKGRLESVFVERHDGYSVGSELYQGIKSAKDIPMGNHVYGGNGTYVSYQHAEYIPTDHKIVAAFLVDVTYYDKEKRQKISEQKRKKVYIDDFSLRYSEKRETVLSLTAPIINKTLDSLTNSTYLFDLKHIKTPDENRWELMDPGFVSYLNYIFKVWLDLTDKFKATQNDILSQKQQIIDYTATALINAVKNAPEKQE